ncbi:MAG: hypothetical protein SGILL_004914, partial [Bacillariaceae sp.]
VLSTSGFMIWISMIAGGVLVLHHRALNGVTLIEERSSEAIAPTLEYVSPHFSLMSSTSRNLSSLKQDDSIIYNSSRKRTNTSNATSKAKEGTKLLTGKSIVKQTTSSSSLPSHYKLGLVRAIGNALPPRHDVNQTLRNLEFTLKYEPPFTETVHKHWVFNRILDEDLLKQLIDLLHQYNQTSYTIIPFVLEDYAKTQYEFVKGIRKDQPDMIHSPEFSSDEWGTMERAAYWDKILTWKNLYITNQNNARNVAIDWYLEKHPEQERTAVVKPSKVDYILPWDGNCFLTQAAHDLLQKDLKRHHLNPDVFKDTKNKSAAKSKSSVAQSGKSRSKTPIRYMFTWMDRLREENEVLLDPEYEPILKEEPQVIMHRSASARFDPKLPYGKKNKVMLLLRLQVHGSWDKFHNGPPLDTPSDWQGATPSAGWVSRLFSGSPHMEERDKSRMRGKARTDGMMMLVRRLDLRVATELNHWNSSTWMYYDRDIMMKYSEMWQQRQTAKNVSSSVAATSYDDFDAFIDDLLVHADSALTAGPWSVVDKESFGCGTSNHCHVYYNVKGRDWYFFLDAVRMIEESGAMSQGNQDSLKAWFVQYLEWLAVTTDSSFRKKGQPLYFERNHHGVYLDLQVVAVASYAGNLSFALQTMQESASRLLTQVDIVGKLKTEIGGSDCEHLQMFTLQGWSSLARVAEKAGIKLWSKLPKRKSEDSAATSALCRAAEYTIPFLHKRARCTNSPKRHPDVSRWLPLFMEARQHCPNVAVVGGKYKWPNWFPTFDSSESPLPTSSPFKMNPLYTQETALAPFWNLVVRQEITSVPVKSTVSVKRAESAKPEPLNSPTKERSLSALPGHYKAFLNGTIDPPKVYLYDVLPDYKECLAKNQGTLDRYKMAYKHGGEVWFLEQVATSPWRTFDKEAADLFVIPLLPGFVLYHKRKAYRGRQQVQNVWWALNKKHQSNVSSNATEDFTFIITKQNPKYASDKDQVVERHYNFTHDVLTTRFGYQGRGDNPTSSRIYEWID